MPFDALARLQRNARRVGEILAVLAKYGLADWLRWLDVDWIQDRLRSPTGERLRELRLEARIRLVLIELGTTFIKLGQVLSTRPDLVGPELAEELTGLQANTVPDPAEVARQTIEADLGKPPEELFATFEGEAFASASIAQVHGATLKTGERVVVKVRRQGVAERAEADLEILHALARLAENHAPSLRQYQPAALVRQFQRTLRRELDFTHERRNLEEFARRFASDPTVHFPAVHASLSGRTVLTMERLEGIPAADGEGLRASRADLNEFARRGAEMYLEMIFRDSVYHADPHPGNVMLLPGAVVGVLDCGMVGRIDAELRDQVEAMLFAAVEQDAAELAEVVLRLGAARDVDRQALRTDLDEFLADYVGQSLREIDVGEALQSLFGLIRRYRIVLPAPLALLLRTLIVLEGTSRQLVHDFSLAELMEPFYARALRRRMSPRMLARRARRTWRDWDRLLDALPRDTREVLGRLREGSFRVHFDLAHLDKVLNRLTLGILVAALILSASALWIADAPPRIGSTSLLGLVAYALALAFGWRLLRAMRRSGDL